VSLWLNEFFLYSIKENIKFLAWKFNSKLQLAHFFRTVAVSAKLSFCCLFEGAIVGLRAFDSVSNPPKNFQGLAFFSKCPTHVLAEADFMWI
jgi:hypothetical protein